jgi:hypothetical protein
MLHNKSQTVSLKGCYGLSPKRLFTELAVHRMPLYSALSPNLCSVKTRRKVRLFTFYICSPNGVWRRQMPFGDGEGDGEGEGDGGHTHTHTHGAPTPQRHLVTMISLCLHVT